MSPARRPLALLPLASLLVATAADCRRRQPDDDAAAPPPAAPQAAAAPEAPPPVTPPILAPGGAAVAPNFADLAARVVPAVVSIKTRSRGRGGHGGPGGPGGADPYDLFRFFGQPTPREYENTGLGSGFFIEREGLILTNQHVIDHADAIEVTFALPDGSEKVLTATVVGQAPYYDVALIKTSEDAHATTIGLGDSDATRIGDWVMAVGNPFGLDHSVSVGIISAKQRRDVSPSGRPGLYDFLQTDASINPGNSGGPLINLRGEVIGINSAINAQGQGIGFAIPINMVRDMLPQLRQGGHFTRSWIGVQIQQLTDDLALSYGLPPGRGVLVAEVVPEGPGARAGLREGDVILEFAGKKLNRAKDLQLFASMAGVGKKVPLTVWRDNASRALEVTLEAFKDDDEDADEAPPGADGGGRDENRTGLGLWIADLSAPLRARLRVTASGGVLVENVAPDSAAGRAGMQRGDVVLEVDGATIRDARDFVRRVGAAKAGAVLRLRLQRQGVRVFTGLRKP